MTKVDWNDKETAYIRGYYDGQYELPVDKPNNPLYMEGYRKGLKEGVAAPQKKE
jgi:hypothetical protein